MKKRSISLVLALLLVFSLLPLSAAAATKPTEADWKTPPVIANLKIDHSDTHVWLEADIKTPDNVINAIAYSQEGDNWEEVGYITTMEMKVTIDGKEDDGYFDMNYSEKNPEVSDGTFSGIYETSGLTELHVDSEVRAQVRYRGYYPLEVSGDFRYSDWSNEIVLNEKSDFTASDWAQTELAEAERLGLIPESLKGQDLTRPITRQEFAAISVKVYESLTVAPADAWSGNSPFADTSDAEVLKAFALGVTNGADKDRNGNTLFVPNMQLNRETLATMLTRVYKKYAFDGWTLEKDGDFASQFHEEFTMPEPFADDKDISGWARDSVYFMNANKIVGGVGDNKFAPRAVTTAEQAAGYAVATREAALVMAVRMVKNLG